MTRCLRLSFLEGSRLGEVSFAAAEKLLRGLAPFRCDGFDVIYRHILSYGFPNRPNYQFDIGSILRKIGQRLIRVCHEEINLNQRTNYIKKEMHDKGLN